MQKRNCEPKASVLSYFIRHLICFITGLIYFMNTDYNFTDNYISFLGNKEFPCVAAKDALAKGKIRVLVADHMACPNDDASILEFLYDFTRMYRGGEKGFYSAAIIFKGPQTLSEEMFDAFMWQRLQSLRDLDAQNFKHDDRVDADPVSENFSFSLMEEAYFIIGLHPESSRQARQFQYPTLVFNPHAQFAEMKTAARYEKMKTIVRKRDIAFSGSVNPMLTDFGEASEVYQYSGRQYDNAWKCPLQFKAHS